MVVTGVVNVAVVKPRAVRVHGIVLGGYNNGSCEVRQQTSTVLITACEIQNNLNYFLNYITGVARVLLPVCVVIPQTAVVSF